MFSTRYLSTTGTFIVLSIFGSTCRIAVRRIVDLPTETRHKTPSPMAVDSAHWPIDITGLVGTSPSFKLLFTPPYGKSYRPEQPLEIRKIPRYLDPSPSACVRTSELKYGSQEGQHNSQHDGRSYKSDDIRLAVILMHRLSSAFYLSVFHPIISSSLHLSTTKAIIVFSTSTSTIAVI
ncbi:hypothetical protein DENSPDRAFT_222922 [Dentipellis sp. KUC8613]|nr:hypothetical protein DENSPDRAFT_222922 [Dentipellis sp. KUC8613]